MPFSCLTLVWSDFLSANYNKGHGGSRLALKGSVTPGHGGGQGKTLAALFPNTCTFYAVLILEVLEITVQGTEFSFPSISQSNLLPQKTACFSLFVCRGRGINTSCEQHQGLWIFAAFIISIFRSSSQRLKMTIKSLFAFNYNHIP